MDFVPNSLETVGKLLAINFLLWTKLKEFVKVLVASDVV